MPNTTTRLITLLMLLQRQPNQKASELAEQLGVSVRTIQRYMVMLDEIGIPVYAERGPHGGYALVRGYRMPPLMFTPEEAAAVYLGTTLVEEMWGRLYHDAAQGALAKLDNVLPDEQRREVARARRTMIATGLHRADWSPLLPLIEKLREAVRDQQRVRMRYRSRGKPDPIQRDVDPYALVHRWGWWYGVGYCHLRQAIRTFRVDRIITLKPLNQHFEVDPDFEIQSYLRRETDTRAQVCVRIRFTPEGALLALDNRVLWETVDERPDGSVIVTLLVPSLEAAAQVVLGYSQHAVVLEPEALRQLIVERARAIVNQYTRDLSED